MRATAPILLVLAVFLAIGVLFDVVGKADQLSNACRKECSPFQNKVKDETCYCLEQAAVWRKP